MDWPTLKTLMLQEPKPSMSFVINQRDPIRTRSARVLHDGDHKWLIWSSEKLEINNGERAIIISNGRLEAHDAPNLYSHGWIKSAVHPRLTNLGDEDSEVEGWDIQRVSKDQDDRWRLRMSGLVEGEETVFVIDVDSRSGSFVRQAHPSVDAVMKVEEFHLGVALAPELFEWMASE